MNAREVNALLAKAAMVDPRSKPVDPDAAADQAEQWAELLRDVQLEDALQALNVHQRESPEVVKPVHILALVRRIVTEYNAQQARALKAVYEKPAFPKPSAEVDARMAKYWSNPSKFAEAVRDYHAELRAAGFEPLSDRRAMDPDAWEPAATAPAPSGASRGQGKDYALPLHDRD